MTTKTKRPKREPKPVELPVGMEVLLTAKQVCLALGISRTTLEEGIRDGSIRKPDRGGSGRKGVRRQWLKSTVERMARERCNVTE